LVNHYLNYHPIKAIIESSIYNCEVKDRGRRGRKGIFRKEITWNAKVKDISIGKEGEGGERERERGKEEEEEKE